MSAKGRSRIQLEGELSRFAASTSTHCMRDREAYQSRLVLLFPTEQLRRH